MASTKLSSDAVFGVMVDSPYRYSVRHPTVIICKMLGAERAFLVDRSGMGSPAVMESKALARGFVDSQVRKPGPGAAVGCF